MFILPSCLSKFVELLVLFWNDFSITQQRKKNLSLSTAMYSSHDIELPRFLEEKGVSLFYELAAYVELNVEIRKLLVLSASCCSHHVTRDS